MSQRVTGKCTEFAAHMTCNKTLRQCKVDTSPPVLYCRSSQPPPAPPTACQQSCCRQGEGSSWRGGAWFRHNRSLFPGPSTHGGSGGTDGAMQVEGRPRSRSTHLEGPRWCYELCTNCRQTCYWTQEKTWYSLEETSTHAIYFVGKWCDLMYVHICSFRLLQYYPAFQVCTCLHDCEYILYRIISNTGAAPVKAPPRAYPIFSRSNCKWPWALELHNFRWL